jgi:acetyl esterase/lipase
MAGEHGSFSPPSPHAGKGAGGLGLLRRSPPRDYQRIRYGLGKHQFGDLRLPAGTGPHPVVIGIHGGYWRKRYGLAYFGQACAALTERGIASWNIEYRRIGNRGGAWPGTFLDVASAADFLRELAPTHDLDLHRVVTLGHSAGGHLALWLAARHRIPEDSAINTPDPLPLQGAVALAGVVDLHRAWELGLSSHAAGELLGGSPEQYPERYAAASPYTLLPLGIRQTLLHGTEDDSVPLELSERYAAAAVAAGDSASLLTLPRAGHFELVDPRSGEWPNVVTAISLLLE